MQIPLASFDDVKLKIFNFINTSIILPGISVNLTVRAEQNSSTLPVMEKGKAKEGSPLWLWFKWV